MAYVTSIVDNFGRTISTENLADIETFRILEGVLGGSAMVLSDQTQSDAGVNGRLGANKYSITGALSPTATFFSQQTAHPDGGTNPVVCDQGVVSIDTGGSISATASLHYHFFNSVIFLNETANPIITSVGNLTSTNSGQFGGAFFHNCKIYWGTAIGNTDVRIAMATNDTQLVFLNSGRRQRFNQQMLGGAILDGVVVDAGSWTDTDLAGFRENIVEIGATQTFNNVTFIKAGVTANGADNVWASELDFINAPVHTANGVNSQPTVIRIGGTSSRGWLFPSSRLDMAIQGSIYGTDDGARDGGRIINASHWTPRFFDNASLNENFSTDIKVKVRTDFNSTGTGFLATSLTNLTTPLEYEYTSNSDGYLESTVDLSGLTADSTDAREWQNIYVPINTSTFNDTGTTLSAVNTNAQFVTATAISTTSHTTTVAIHSPFGSTATFKTYNDTNSRIASSASNFQDNATPVYERNDETTLIDAPDAGMTHYTGSDRAAQITTIKAKFGSTSDVTLNDIASLYKIALSEDDDATDSTYIDDYLNVDADPTWDISGNTTFDSLELDSTLTDEYELDVTNGIFKVQAASIVAETDADFTVTGIKCFDLDLNGSVADGFNIDVTNQVLNPLVFTNDGTVVTAFDNLTINGEILFSLGASNTRNVTFGSSVTYGASASILVGSGFLNVRGAVTSDFSSVGPSGDFAFPFAEEVTIDASAAEEDVIYRILIDGNTDSNTDTFGTIDAGTSLTVTLSDADYSTLADGVDMIIAVSGADVFAQRFTRAVDGTNNSSTITLANNPNYASGGTVSTAVSGTSVYSFADDVFVWTVEAGTSIGGGDANATFGSFKSVQAFADFISDVGTDGDFAYPSTVSFRLDPTYHEIETEETSSSTSQVAIQGLSVTSGTVASLVTEGTFSGPGTVGLTVTADTAIDYGSFGAEVQARTDQVIANLESESQDIQDQAVAIRNFITDNDDDNFDAANGG